MCLPCDAQCEVSGVKVSCVGEFVSHRPLWETFVVGRGRGAPDEEAERVTRVLSAMSEQRHTRTPLLL